MPTDNASREVVGALVGRLIDQRSFDAIQESLGDARAAGANVQDGLRELAQ